MSEHTFAALFISSITVILHHLDVLNGLDALFLRLAKTSTPILSESAGLPTVLGIGDLYYEKDFGQASPLNRAELLNIIKKITRSRPQVIAIDLDLSPGLKPSSKNTAADRIPGSYTCEEHNLYTYLRETKPGGPQFVLQLPFPVYDTELRKHKLKWMKQMCEQAGIEFGRVTISSSFGMVTEISHRRDRLSCTVYRMKNKTFFEEIDCNNLTNKDAYKLCNEYAHEICIGGSTSEDTQQQKEDGLKKQR